MSDQEAVAQVDLSHADQARIWNMHQSFTKTQNWTSFFLSCYFIIIIFVTSFIGQSNAELQNNSHKDSKFWVFIQLQLDDLPVLPEFIVRAANQTLRRKVYEKKPKEFHLQPFFVGLHVKELHILGHDNSILTFHTLWIKPNVHHYKLESVHPKSHLYIEKMSSSNLVVTLGQLPMLPLTFSATTTKMLKLDVGPDLLIGWNIGQIASLALTPFNYSIPALAKDQGVIGSTIFTIQAVNAVTETPIDDLPVVLVVPTVHGLSPASIWSIEQSTNYDGHASFLIPIAQDRREQFQLQINDESYHSYHHVLDQSTLIKPFAIRMRPKHRLRLHVTLEKEEENGLQLELPALGAVVDWVTEDNDEIMLVNAQGIVDIPLPTTSSPSFFKRLVVSMPGMYHPATLTNLPVHLHPNPPFITHLSLILRKVQKFQYEIPIPDTLNFNGEKAPEVFLYSNTRTNPTQIDVTSCHFLEAEGKFKVEGDIKATIAFLYLEQRDAATIILHDLKPQDQNPSEEILRDLIADTVKVVIRMVDHQFQPLRSPIKLTYILPLLSRGINEMESDESGLVTFYLPSGFLVHLLPLENGVADNPSFFQAAEGLEVYLLVNQPLQLTVTLTADNFVVPLGTVIRYEAVTNYDQTHGMGLTNSEGSLAIPVKADTNAIQFFIGGSDGFDPVYFQPFEYFYNLTSILYDGMDLDIPILTRKNTLVSVKECGTGHILNQPALISFPRDSAMHTISADHQHSSWTDDQGMAFFYLQPDIFIPYGVTATGYISHHSSLSLSANGTHLVEVNLCPMIILKLRLLEEDSWRSLPFTTIQIYLDHDPPDSVPLVTTDANGVANLTISTAIRNLDLQIIEAGPNFSPSPVFEIFDEGNVLKRSNVSVNILPRMFVVELMTFDCTNFQPLSNVSVFIEMDNTSRVTLTSDESGTVSLRLTENTHKVLATTEPSRIRLWHKEDWPLDMEFFHDHDDECYES